MVSLQALNNPHLYSSSSTTSPKPLKRSVKLYEMSDFIKKVLNTFVFKILQNKNV